MFRSVLNNIRLAILVFIFVPLALLGATMAAIEWWSGAGTVEVQASPGESVTVAIDGAAPYPVAEGSHYEQELPQGTHHVTVSGPLGQSSFDVSVTNGMWRALIPTSPQQCWVELDVYEFYYAPSRSQPTIEGRYPGNAPVPIGSGAHFDESTLPRSVSEHSSVNLWQPIPCAMMGATDDQLILGLGFQL